MRQETARTVEERGRGLEAGAWADAVCAPLNAFGLRLLLLELALLIYNPIAI
jgi:hypothetical protein